MTVIDLVRRCAADDFETVARMLGLVDQEPERQNTREPAMGHVLRNRNYRARKKEAANGASK